MIILVTTKYALKDAIPFQYFLSGTEVLYGSENIRQASQLLIP